MSKLKKLSREVQTLEDVLSSAFTHSDDRSFAIVQAADLDNCLELRLRKGMIELTAPERAALFYNQGAPLSTFSSKITMGYSLGYYGKQTKLDLNRVREIRNAFAHAQRPINFETKEIAETCALFDVERRFPIPFEHYTGFSLPRRQFWTIVKLLSATLVVGKEDQRPGLFGFNSHPLD